METIYTCTNLNCSYPGNTQYEIRFKSESIMDHHNMAATFCPFCKKEMLPAHSHLNDIPETPIENLSSHL